MIPLDVSSSKAIGVRMAETCETAEEEHIPDGVKVFFPSGSTRFFIFRISSFVRYITFFWVDLSVGLNVL